eukprot:NODE_755_length_4181_cov_0.632533.p1 type:complete len:722 gc:universal NODE_755_length_4181_cov_0.632533:3817-1652(-)
MINPFTTSKYSQKHDEILKTRKKLPVYKYKNEFVEMLDNNKVFLIIGETGSGKTTQLPQFAAEHYLKESGVIACTQPRRVAAMSVAERVATEMDVELGKECGYKIRFEDMTCMKTKLIYLTDGMLLREAMTDPLLLKYKVILLDESHERTLATDILMGVLKELLTKREDIKIVVMSATLDSEKFSTFFNAPLLKIPGRTFPVDIFYADKPQKDYLESSIETVKLIHEYEDEGDILVFLTGEDEIEDACQRIRQSCKSLKPITVLPLYSQLNPAEQKKIFLPASKTSRKCVVATNIAETSITVDGVVYVVDPGFVKQKAYNPQTRMQSLQVTPISKASANQRSGRAGRTRPGKCFRLYTEASFNDLIPQTYPEMQRSNLTHVVLQLFKIGIDDIVNFAYMDPPSPGTLIRALEMLNYLGAIDDDGQMTEIGHLMSDLPLDPEYAKIVLTAPKYDCVEDVLSIIAMLSVPNCLLRPIDKREEADSCHSHFKDQNGDHFTLLNIFKEFIQVSDKKQWCWENYLNMRNLNSAVRIKQQLKQYLPKKSNYKEPENKNLHEINIKKCLLEGFFSFVAYYNRTAKSYKTVKDNQDVKLHPSSVVKKKEFLVMFNEVVQTAQDYIRTCTPINQNWLLEVNIKYYDMSNFPSCELRDNLLLEYKKRIGVSAKRPILLEEEHKEFSKKKKKRTKTPEEIKEKEQRKKNKKENKKKKKDLKFLKNESTDKDL